MKNIFESLKAIISHFPYFREHSSTSFMRSVSIALVLKVTGAGIAFSLNIVLARLLGADGVGVYYLAASCVFLVSTIGRCGLEKYLVRNISIGASGGSDSSVKGVYQKSMEISFGASLILAIFIVIFREQISSDIFSRPMFDVPLFIVAVALIPYSLLVLNSQALIGLKKIKDSLLVSSVIVPL